MLADGTIPTIEDEEDIYISLTSLCEYFTRAAISVKQETDRADTKSKKYAMGLQDMMYSIAEEFVQLGKFEAQKRMINSPEDLFKMIDKYKGDSVE
jgi:hypothetical protein